MELELFSDIQLMTLFRYGREDAFRVVYERHRDRVYRIGLRMSGHENDAEEIVQETFLRVARAAHRYQPTAAFTTWLHRIAIRVSLTLVQRTQSKVVRLFEHPRAVAAGQSLTTPEANMEAHQLATALQQRLLELDMSLRSAFILRICEGLSNAEVAAILDIPEATVRTHVHRARNALRRSMFRVGVASPTRTQGETP